MKLFLVLSVLLVVAQSVKIPSNFKKCNRKSPNFKTCLLEAARHGVTQLNRPYKDLKMASLDPWHIPEIQASINVPSVNVSCLLTDCKFSGLTATEIKNFDFDFEQKTIKLDGFFPKLKSECGYKIDGLILFVPLRGEGSSSAQFYDFNWSFNLTYEEVKRRGKTYVKAISAHFDGKPESLRMNMDELFGGDKELGERANRIINDNWGELYDAVKSNYLEYAQKVFLQTFNGWFTKLSIEEAFD